MIRFELEEAHPLYRPLIIEKLSELAEKYPWAPLDLVKLYDLKRGDRSLGNATTKKQIALNPFWFTKDPAILKEAATGPRYIRVRGQKIGWHGEMTAEPDHLLTHEFGHIVSDALQDWQKFATLEWIAATYEPKRAVAGYALVNEIEYFAETFAAFELGVIPDRLAEPFRQVLAEH